MRCVIIESPYKASPGRTVADNLGYARTAMLHSLTEGEAPFASHLLYTQVLDDLDPPQRTTGIAAGLAWGPAADLVAAYVDYGLSHGMRLGIAAATARGTRVVYRFRALTHVPIGGLFAESLMLPSAYNHEVF